jgi:hypothetical protein
MMSRKVLLCLCKKAQASLDPRRHRGWPFFVPCINSPHALKSVAIPHNVSEGQGDAVWRCRVTGIEIEQNRKPLFATRPVLKG